MDSSLSEIDAVFLDLDGTMYLGNHLIEGALEFLERCESRGVRRFFLSNNSSRSVDQYLQKLSGMGIPATADDVLLSTHDLLSWLATNDVKDTWLVGTEGMSKMLESEGISTKSDQPEYVVLGYDNKFGYKGMGDYNFLIDPFLNYIMYINIYEIHTLLYGYFVARRLFYCRTNFTSYAEPSEFPH